MNETATTRCRSPKVRTPSRLAGSRRALTAAVLFMAAQQCLALTTPAIIASITSLQCLEYRVVGICYWLLCTPFGCTVKTSPKVRHFIPELVVSSYSDTGASPWVEMATLSAPTLSSQGGGNLITPSPQRDNLLRFKNVDGIGHPGGAALTALAHSFGYACPSGAVPLAPYYLSTLDPLAWRQAIPESAYPQALIPGSREIGSQALGNMWGSVYPRHGFLVQADDFKASAVMAQRASDFITRVGQPHVYLPLQPKPYPGYWPPQPVMENNVNNHRWQLLSPVIQSTCAIFPSPTIHSVEGGYAWSLWRPYRCCQRMGQTLLFSIDFEGGQG
ncbi:TIGR03756 family integrating conjugative element protein [Pseudomonas sp. NFX224]|uniref:TIGR03756 family integrating conjugative element protein n=1 Tax=Pseudomonas sp. NFX224 TaxID=3402862 RepID=UPI003AFA2AC5